jgi:hypothetical protein
MFYVPCFNKYDITCGAICPEKAKNSFGIGSALFATGHPCFSISELNFMSGTLNPDDFVIQGISN